MVLDVLQLAFDGFIPCMNQCTCILKQHKFLTSTLSWGNKFHCFDTCCCPFCTLTADNLIWWLLVPILWKTSHNCFLFMFSVPSEILQTSLISLPQLSLFLAEEAYLIESLLSWPLSRPFVPSSLFSESFSILPQHFWDAEKRTVPCSQDKAALWTQNHIMKLFLFHSVPFPVTPTTWAASMAVTELFIEIWIITPRSFSWIVISNSEPITKYACLCVCACR